MTNQVITPEQIAAFGRTLQEAERSSGTIEKYLRDVRNFPAFLEGESASRERAAAWRDGLLEQGYAPVTINSMVGAVNAFFRMMGWEACRIKALRIQRKLFREDRRELTREEYERLLLVAQGRVGSVWLCCWRPSAGLGFESVR